MHECDWQPARWPYETMVCMYMYRFARRMWDVLPLTPATRHRLSGALRRWWRKVATAGAPQLAKSKQVQLLPGVSGLRHGWRPGVRVVMVFAVIGWHFRIQRPQQLARQLAGADNSVLYIEPNFVDSQEPGYVLTRIQGDGDIWTVQLHLHTNPAIYYALPKPAMLAQLRLGMAALLADLQIEASVALLDHVFWSDLAFTLPNCIRVYDCMDHHEGFGGVSPELLLQEMRLIKHCDQVVVTSGWLKDWVAPHRPNAALVRNGCDFAYFSTPPEQVYNPKTERKVIGYIGAIAEWFDVELVKKIAQRFEDHQVLLIGADTVKAADKLKGCSNVVFLGEKPYQDLTQYLYAFDVCLLPFVVNQLTLATNPVKVYEYLCAGRHVVCTELPEISQFGSLVHSASNHDDFLQAIASCLATPPDAALVQQRQTFASCQTWEHRALELRNSLEQIVWPKISVVVLSYNNWTLTEACLHSVLNDSEYPGELDLIVVDNASGDETATRLRGWATLEPRLRLQLNETNLGFAAGNNVGMVMADGDYVALLNNDTVVTRGWLLTLLRHLQADARLGLVGPVTNNIGNEAKVDVSYTSPLDMPAATRRFTLAHMGAELNLQTIAFFCVMFPRKVMQEVGLLDEGFGRGFFEDDDYCRRVERAGYRIACADDVFVHHHLSASFDKLKSDERQRLFEENKRYYESKWGKWEPHTYRPKNHGSDGNPPIDQRRQK